MARLPKITLQGWTADGPAYTIHHPIAGFRNRKARRAGTGGEERVGRHREAKPHEGPAAYMLYAKGDMEVYAFKHGYVYLVTLLVDGDPLAVLVDAREDDRIETYGADLQLLEQRALEGDELEAALADGPAHMEFASDGAESQEPHAGHGDPGDDEPEITALTGSQVEAPPEQQAPEAPVPNSQDETDSWVAVDGENVNPDAPFTDPDGDGTPEGEAEGRYVDPIGDVSELTPEAAQILASRDTPSDDDGDSSSGPHNYDGTVAEFAELVEAMEDHELEDYAARDSRKGVREAAAHELDHRSSTD